MLYAACCLHEPAGDVTGAHFSKRKDQTAGGVTGAQVIGVRIERSSSYAVCCTYAVCCMLHAVFIQQQGTFGAHFSKRMDQTAGGVTGAQVIGVIFLEST